MRLIASALFFLAAGIADAAPPPKLIVAISVDQFSADLFAEYRATFTGGLKRLQEGAVFPSGYQSHAATETCPGHSTILTGARPARTGIIANEWTDLSAGRRDKNIYCGEDESVPGSDSKNYTVSPVHLRVPTLGDRMKAIDSRSRVFSVAGKDRSALMMGGHRTDEMWWWSSKGFVSFAGRAQPAIVATTNQRVGAMIATGLPAPVLPAQCAVRIAPIVMPGKTVGEPLGGLAPGDAAAIRSRAELDQAVLDIAKGFIDAEKLGRGNATDLIAVGLSVTDYVGHGFGTEGPEMCTQIQAVDAALGEFLGHLDETGISYVVTLTADHGGHDLPERNATRGLSDATRISASLSLARLNEAMGVKGEPIWYGGIGDLYLSPSYKGSRARKTIAKAKAWLLAQPQIAAVYGKDELRNVPPPPPAPEDWTLRDRAAASFDSERSGDLTVFLKPRISPIANPGKGAVTTHGSPWNYDRRVPILFWWPGMKGFEQPNGIETVDIMPTLAALIGLPFKAEEIDGQCRDLDPGPETTCPNSTLQP